MQERVRERDERSGEDGAERERERERRRRSMLSK